MKSVCGSCLVSASGGRRINLVLLKQSVAEVASLERHLSLRGVFWRRNRSAHSFPQVSLTAPEVSFSLDTHTHAHRCRQKTCTRRHTPQRSSDRCPCFDLRAMQWFPDSLAEPPPPILGWILSLSTSDCPDTEHRGLYWTE